MEFVRKDGRGPAQLRPFKITRNVNKYSLGSALCEMGDTKVLCCVSVEERVPLFLRNSGTGWLTAEYGMLPLSSPQRIFRANYAAGRNLEIQRLIGRVLRSMVFLKNFGEKTLWVDCDVIQADGGTRTAAINGAFFALADALSNMKKKNLLILPILKHYLAAVSVGIVGGKHYLDLSYEEDSIAQVDFNMVMNEKGQFAEVQGAAEGTFFSKAQLDEILQFGKKGTEEIINLEKETLNSEIKDLFGN